MRWFATLIRSSITGMRSAKLLCLSTFFSSCPIRYAVSFDEATIPPKVPTSVPTSDNKPTIISLLIICYLLCFVLIDFVMKLFLMWELIIVNLNQLSVFINFSFQLYPPPITQLSFPLAVFYFHPDKFSKYQCYLHY